jgi:hypothetical protein
MKMKLLITLIFALALGSAFAADKTAFQLVAEGNNYLGADSRDQVVQIRSEKSVGGLTPTVWYIVYREPGATFKTVEIKFGNGQRLSTHRPWRVYESTVGNNAAFNKAHLKKDSDEALKLAMSQPQLAGLKLRSSKIELIKGGQPHPVWKIEFWAERRSDPARDTSVGDVWISAFDGRVIQSRLKPKRAD